jgi:hypothetical protein
MGTRPSNLNEMSMAMKYAEKYKDVPDDELEKILDEYGISTGIRRYIYKFRRRYDRG